MNEQKKDFIRSFRFKPIDEEMLKFLVEKWGCNANAVMRRTLADAYFKILYQKDETN